MAEHATTVPWAVMSIFPQFASLGASPVVNPAEAGNTTAQLYAVNKAVVATGAKPSNE